MKKEYEYFFYNKKDEYVKSKRFICLNEIEANKEASKKLNKTIVSFLLVNTYPVRQKP